MVAQLLSSNGREIDETGCYAELWMGTHPNGPARIAATPDVLLQDAIGEDLPFLFKVLSVETALSIQAHPDRQLAQKLHAERPEVCRLN